MQTSLQVHGEIKSIGEPQQVSDKFCKREFVLITDQNTPYPQTIQFELQQDRVDVIDAYHIGQQVSVDFLLRGRQWENNTNEIKTFNTLVCWKIQKV